uniref:Fe2OG dioxygenase domain-containing protein n=1 Tax=Plectus sambesii TaxID=2011161 RepID=A0A914UQS0_9BILA
MNTFVPYGLAFALLTLAGCLGTETDDDEGFCDLDNEADCGAATEKSSSFILSQLQFDLEVGGSHELRISDGRSLKLRLLSKRPLLYEIDDFLSSDEADHVVAEAGRRGLVRSGTEGGGFAAGVRLMDADNDRILTIAEMRRTLEHNFDAHFTEIDVRRMYDELRLDPNGDDVITPEELQQAMPDSKALGEYVRQVMQKNARLRGRNSENMFFFPDRETDGIIQSITDRVAQAMGLPGTLVEKSDMQIVHYGIGGHYNIHLDSAEAPPDRQIPCCTRFDGVKACRSCRWATLLFYLNDVIEGGETAFPVADDPSFDADIFHNEFRENLHVQCDSESVRLRVKPEKGKAVLWYNHLPTKEGEYPWFGAIDHNSRHGSCPVKQGEKWIANFWIKVTDDKNWDLSHQE